MYHKQTEFCKCTEVFGYILNTRGGNKTCTIVAGKSPSALCILSNEYYGSGGDEVFEKDKLSLGLEFIPRHTTTLSFNSEAIALKYNLLIEKEAQLILTLQ